MAAVAKRGEPSLSPALALGSVYLRVALKLITGAGLITMIYVWCQYFWYDEFYAIFGNLMAKLGLVYTYGKQLTPPAKTMDQYDATYTLLFWVPLGGGSLFMIAAQRLPNHAKPEWLRRTQLLGRRIMQYQLPPRHIWINWCGGFSVLDFLVMSTILMMNLMWFIVGMKNFNERYRAMDEAGIVPVHSVTQLRLEWAGLYFGVLLFNDVWLLLLPIPQSSFLQDLSGLDYHQMIRYHRWMGHVTMIVTTLHGILYYIYWGLTDQFSEMFVDWSKDSSINYLAGSISWFFGLILWVTSMNWCRRRFWEVYYRAHIVCFLGFMLFAYIHYSGSWIYFTPGLLLWFIDLVLRAGAFGNTTTVSNCGVNATEDVVTLQLQASERAATCPLHDIYLLLPSISRWQWHPFTISHQTADGALTVRIKHYGRWTQSLLHKLKLRQPFAIRASCPPYSGPHQWRQDDVVVVLAGGIASTSVLRVLSDLTARHQSGKKSPRKVYFVWVARHAIEFCVMDLAVANESMSPAGWLTTRLHYTGKTPLEDDKAMGNRRLDSLEKLSSNGSEESDPKPGESVATKAGALKFPRASPFFWNKARRLQPQISGPIHHAIVTGLVFFGGFVGRDLAYNWYAEWYTHYTSSGLPLPYLDFYWRQAGVDFLCFFVVGLGFPFICAVFLPHLYRYWKDTRKGGDPEELMGAFDGTWDPSSMGCELAGASLFVAGGDVSIPIEAGRPDFESILINAAKETGASHIGVYVAGPTPLLQSAHMVVSKLNSFRSKTFFDYHKMAGFL